MPGFLSRQGIKETARSRAAASLSIAADKLLEGSRLIGGDAFIKRHETARL